MKSFYLLFYLVACFAMQATAQALPFGQIDTADLKMTSCNFEKEANAMVLFDVGKIAYGPYGDVITMDRHKRIKIFNDKALDLANIRFEYWAAKGYENIDNIEAETINLVGDKIERTPIDKKLIYLQKVDKQRRAIVFTLPNVKAGSVIDLKYRWKTNIYTEYPPWIFQNVIPSRYSEVTAGMSWRHSINVIRKLTIKPTIDTLIRSQDDIAYKWVMVKIPSFRLEPYMRSVEDNVQGVYFRQAKMLNSWQYIAKRMLEDPDFGGQINQSLANEGQIIADTKVLATREEKIAFLFNTVKNTVKWNNVDKWYTQAGISAAWSKKTGNSTEINLILYRLLTQAGVQGSLLALGTRDNDELEENNPSFGRLNKTVVRVPIDSLNFYVLDATGKYNTFSDTPYELLGINMLPVDKEHPGENLIALKTGVSSKTLVLINAEIKPDGRLEGSTQLSSSNYKRINKLYIYDKVGEKKYLDDEIKEGNNTLQVSGLKFENMESDTLPLREDFNFKLELTGSDDNYIYFSPNLFTGLAVNPFINETRVSDIDFIYPATYSVNGHYKIPKGFKIDVMPKQLKLDMPDKGISFSRVIGEMDGDIVVHYVIDFRKTRYTREEYPDLRMFYRRMFEMLNEQIVLKKS